MIFTKGKRGKENRARFNVCPFSKWSTKTDGFEKNTEIVLFKTPSDF